MSELRDLAYRVLDAFDNALEVCSEDVAFEGPAQEYAAMMLPRLRGTFRAISSLLKNGYLDEAVMLTRRQNEDSLRLHYMYAHAEQSDGLILDFMRWREELVLKPMSQIINNVNLARALRNQAKPMAALRRKRIDELRRKAEQSGVEMHRFPELSEIASDLNRHADMIAYASAAEVSHSALSAVTSAYTTHDISGRVFNIEETSDRPKETVAFARSAINSTGIAVIFAMKLLGRVEDAQQVTLAGSNLQQRLQRAQGP